MKRAGTRKEAVESSRKEPAIINRGAGAVIIIRMRQARRLRRLKTQDRAVAARSTEADLERVKEAELRAL